jgi:hypothetical protein
MPENTTWRSQPDAALLGDASGTTVRRPVVQGMALGSVCVVAPGASAFFLPPRRLAVPTALCLDAEVEDDFEEPEEAELESEELAEEEEEEEPELEEEEPDADTAPLMWVCKRTSTTAPVSV